MRTLTRGQGPELVIQIPNDGEDISLDVVDLIVRYAIALEAVDTPAWVQAEVPG